MTDVRWIPLYIMAAMVGAASAPILHASPPSVETTVIVDLPRTSDARSIVLVVDGSGSMSEPLSDHGTKIEATRAAITTLSRQLRPADSLSLVVFGDHAQVLLRHSAPDAPAVRDAVRRLLPSGATNLHEGLQLGVDLALQRGSKGHVVLLSDGAPNVGVVDHSTIEGLADSVAISAIGIGDDFHETLLRRLSHRGTFHHADSDLAHVLRDVTLAASPFGTLSLTASPGFDIVAVQGRPFPPQSRVDLPAGHGPISVGLRGPNATAPLQSVQLSLDGRTRSLSWRTP